MIALGLFAAGVWLAERLPVRLLYCVASLVGAAQGALPLAPQRRLRENEAVVLGAPPGSLAVRRAAVAATQLRARSYVDLFRNRIVSSHSVAARFVEEGEGWALFWKALEERRGLVLVSAHFGRFELFSHYLGHFGVKLTLAVERLHPPALFDLVCRLRQRPGYHLIPHDAALRPSMRALRRGEAVVFFADWDPSGHSVPVQFFGRAATLPGGPAFLARRAGVPIFAGFSFPGARPGTYRAVMGPPIEVGNTENADADVKEATQRIAQVFERVIVQHPDHWIMFHRIWPA